MRINLHVIVIGAGLTGSFFLNDCVSSYETGKFDPDGYYGF